MVELELEAAGHLEVDGEAVAHVVRLVREHDAARAELRHGLGEVVAVEREVVRPGRAEALALPSLDGVATEVGLGEVEDQPAASDVRVGEPELVAEEGAELGRFRGVEQGVDASDHRILQAPRAESYGASGSRARAVS